MASPQNLKPLRSSVSKEWARIALPRWRERRRKIRMLQRDGTDKDKATLQINTESWRKYSQLPISINLVPFAFVIPARNEEQSLLLCLHTILQSPLPENIPISIIIVVNGSSDRTEEVAIKGLQLLSHVSNSAWDPSAYDPNIHKPIRYSERKNIKMYLVVTDTPSKSNAMNIGHAISQKLGASMTFGMDADVFIEEQSIPELYGAAYQAFFIEQTGVLAFGLNYYTEERATLPYRLLYMPRGVRRRMYLCDTVFQLTGSFQVIKSEWFQKIGGYPSIICDERFLQIEALAQGMKPVWLNTPAWAFPPTRIISRMRNSIRATRGHYQLWHRFLNDPLRMNLLMNSRCKDLLPWHDRLKTLGKAISQKPQSIIRFVIQAILEEISFAIGKLQFYANPTKVTWRQLKDTK